MYSKSGIFSQIPIFRYYMIIFIFQKKNKLHGNFIDVLNW